jgi:hypothetical protein
MVCTVRYIISLFRNGTQGAFFLHYDLELKYQIRKKDKELNKCLTQTIFVGLS